MKKTAIILKIFLVLTITIYSQEIKINIDPESKQTFTEIKDSLLKIDQRSVPEGILYDRVVPFAGLQRFNKEQPDTSNYQHFIQAYSEINRASYSEREMPLEVKELRRAIDRKLNAEEQIVPVGLLAYRFAIIDSHAYEEGKLKIEDGMIIPNVTDHSELFKKKEVFVASPLVKEFLSSRATFIISPDWIYSNLKDNIQNLEIDFDDGVGFRKLDLNKEQKIDVFYNTTGKKVVTFRMEFHGKKIIETKASFYVNIEDVEKRAVPDLPFDSIHFFADIPFPDYSGSTFKGKGEVTYIYSNSSKILQKPIIIVDGFDPGDKRNDFGRGYVNGEPRTESIWELFNAEPYSMADQLMSQGYDIVILNFPVYYNEYGARTDGGADFIERNGLVLVELINQVNQKLTTNGSDEELVILGPSMGGQVSRYALAYMEQNNMDHNTRLWISIDSPHPSNDLPLGANINLGAQNFLWFFGEIGEDEGALDRWENTVCSNAAQQMLIRHRLSYGAPHGYHQTFSNNMEQIGFPENLRKVSIANGSLNGTLFNSPCQKAYEMEYSLLGIRLAFAKIYQQPGYGDVCTVFKGRFTDYSLIPGIGVIIINSVNIGIPIGSDENSCSYDVAPGGTLNTYQQIEEAAAEGELDLTTNEALIESHSFISTKSALAFTGGNQNLAENISTRNLVATGETPFDSYWGPLNKNMEHVSFDNNLMNWILNEINDIQMPPIIDFQISGPLLVCGSATYYIENLPDGATVSWSWSPQDAFNYPPFGMCSPNALCVVSDENTENAVVYAEISHPYWNNSIEIDKKFIQVGVPAPQISDIKVWDPNNPGQLAPECLCLGDEYYVEAEFFANIDNYSWELHSSEYPYYWHIGNEQTSEPFTITGLNPDYHIEAKQYSDDCGWSDVAIKNISCVTNCGGILSDYTFTVYPNPVNNTLYVDIEANDNNKHSNDFPDNLKLKVNLHHWDSHLVLTEDFFLSEMPHAFDVSGLPEDKYILNILYEDDPLHVQQILIKR